MSQFSRPCPDGFPRSLVSCRFCHHRVNGWKMQSMCIVLPLFSCCCCTLPENMSASPQRIVACFIDSACRQHYRRGYLLFSTRLGRQTFFFVFNGISCDVSFRNACGKALWYECFREFTDPFYTTEERWIFLLPISFSVDYN